MLCRCSEILVVGVEQSIEECAKAFLAEIRDSLLRVANALFLSKADAIPPAIALLMEQCWYSQQPLREEDVRAMPR